MAGERVRHSDHNGWYRGVAAIGGVNPNVNSGHKREDYRCAPDLSTARQMLILSMLMLVIRASRAR